MYVNSFQQLVYIMEITYSLWHEMNTYYLSVFNDFNYYISPEHNLHFRYILCISFSWWSTHISFIIYSASVYSL
jgi:hypothetical protein